MLNTQHHTHLTRAGERLVGGVLVLDQPGLHSKTLTGKKERRGRVGRREEMTRTWFQRKTGVGKNTGDGKVRQGRGKGKKTGAERAQGKAGGRPRPAQTGRRCQEEATLQDCWCMLKVLTMPSVTSRPERSTRYSASRLVK